MKFRNWLGPAGSSRKSLARSPESTELYAGWRDDLGWRRDAVSDRASYIRVHSGRGQRGTWDGSRIDVHATTAARENITCADRPFWQCSALVYETFIFVLQLIRIHQSIKKAWHGCCKMTWVARPHNHQRGSSHDASRRAWQPWAAPVRPRFI